MFDKSDILYKHFLLSCIVSSLCQYKFWHLIFLVNSIINIDINIVINFSSALYIDSPLCVLQLYLGITQFDNNASQ